MEDDDPVYLRFALPTARHGRPVAGRDYALRPGLPEDVTRNVHGPTDMTCGHSQLGESLREPFPCQAYVHRNIAGICGHHFSSS